MTVHAFGDSSEIPLSTENLMLNIHVKRRELAKQNTKKRNLPTITRLKPDDEKISVREGYPLKFRVIALSFRWQLPLIFDTRA